MNFPVLSNSEHPRIAHRPRRVPLSDEDVAIARDDDVIRLIQAARLGRLVPFARFSLDPERQKDLSLRAQFQDDVRADIGHPDIAVAIDVQAVRPRQEAFAESSNEFPVRIEFKERMGPASGHEEMALRVECHARGRSHRCSRGNRKRVGDSHVLQQRRILRNQQCWIGRTLRESRAAHRQNRERDGGRPQVGDHASSSGPENVRPHASYYPDPPRSCHFL